MICADLDALQQDGVDRLCADDAATLRSLTGSPYLLEAILVVPGVEQLEEAVKAPQPALSHVCLPEANPS